MFLISSHLEKVCENWPLRQVFDIRVANAGIRMDGWIKSFQCYWKSCGMFRAVVH